MKKTAVLGVLGFSLAIIGAAQANQSASAAVKASKPTLHVVAGAKALTIVEKAGVSGKCGDEIAPCTKPGYGFGDDKHCHYGPPGHDFNPSDTWREHVGTDGLAPDGHPLPPHAFLLP